MSGRIAVQKRKNEESLLRMQFFCLDPKYTNYIDICDNKRLCNEQSDYISIWKLAAECQYGQYWDIPDKKDEFERELKKLRERLLMRPTSVILDKMWYVFFATGDINALRDAYEVAGNNSASESLRTAASDQFANFRDEYRRKITEALAKDPNYFKNHETVYGTPDETNPLLQTSTVFDRFQGQIDAATRQLEADEDEIIGKFTSTPGTPGKLDEPDEPDELAEPPAEPAEPPDAIMLELSRRFDAIAKDVLGSRYVTKSG